MSNTEEAELDVLIVGSGPTGLSAAGLMAQHGLRCRLIDRAGERSDRSRALVVQPRTLELFDKLGLAEDLIARGRRTQRVSVYVNRRHAVSVALDDLGTTDTPYPFVLFVSQAETERHLLRHCTDQGVRDERGVELVSFTQDASGVTAVLGHGDGRREEVRAAYLLGADGAHSVVRKQAGLSFTGEAYSQDFALGDVSLDWSLGHDELVLCLGPGGAFVVFPLAAQDDNHAARVLSVRGEGTAADAGDPTLAELQALADERGPVPMTLRDPRWLARFRLHHRGVDRYQVGRVFVAGDAAHIHSPVGGQGMNTGIQDAWNLAWKLALVRRGQVSAALLASYHEERHPVGQRLLRSTDRLFTMVTTRSSVVRALRDVLVSQVVPRVLGFRSLRERAFRFVGQLDVGYDHSSVVAEAQEGQGFHPQGAVPEPRPGHRAPDAPLRGAFGTSGDHSLLALLRGTRHHLLVFSGVGKEAESPEAQRAVGEAAARSLQGLGEGTGVHLLGAEATVAHERYALRGPGLYLIRPDGYVAFRAAGLGVAALDDYLRQLRG